MNNRILKRVSSLILCIALLFSAFCAAPQKSAAVETTDLYKACAVPVERNTDVSSKTLIDSYAENTFETENENFEITKGSFKGLIATSVNKSEEGEWPVTLNKTYKTPLDLSEFNEIYFRVFAGEYLEGEKIEFEITLYSRNISHTTKVSFETGAEYDIYCPISKFESSHNITEISVTINCPDETNRLIVSALYGDEKFNYSHIPLFSTDTVTSENETELFEDRIEINVTEGSGAVEGLLKWIPAGSKTVCAMVTVSGADAGTVTLSTGSSFAEYTDVATLTLSGGKNRYSFMFPVSDKAEIYRLTFAGVAESENEKLTLHSAVMEYFSEDAFDSADYAGNISSCSVLEGGSKIKLNGTIRSGEVANNIGARLNVYAKNDYETVEADAVLMASVDITTVFEITFDTNALKLNPYLYKYYITIQTEESESAASAPVYPSVTPANFKSGSSVLGIQSFDSTAAFNTNASHTVVDIYLDKLLSTDGKGGRVHAYGGSFCYLSGSYINELDSKLNFLSGSGVNVYLRLLFENKYPDTSAVYLIPNSRNYTEALSYMTMIDFLSSRYSAISGIIVGSRIDCSLYSYSEDKSIISRYENYANLLRLTCISARPNAADAPVIVPFGDGYVYDGDGDGESYLYDAASGIGEAAADPVMASEIVSHMISKYGAFKWHLLYECESEPAKAMNTAYKLAAQLTQGSGASPSGQMVFWQPEKHVSSSDINLLFEDLTENAVSMTTEAVIISFTRHATDPTITIKNIEHSALDDNSSRTVSRHNAMVILRPSQKGRCDFWDFTKSFSTEGFIFGGSVSSLSTEVSLPMAAFEALDSCRCLSGAFDKESTSSGTVLCYFDSPKLLTNATSLDVSINVLSEENKTIPVKIILGKGNVRYEYTAELSPSTPSVIRCNTDVMDEKFAAEYMAVSIEKGGCTSFEITKISAINRNYEEGTLRELLDGTIKTETEITKESKLIITSVAFVGITAVVFVLLNVRHASSNKESGKKSKTDK